MSARSAPKVQEAAEVSVSSSFPARIKWKLYSVVHSRDIPEPAASAGVHTHWITNISFQFFTKTVALAFICFKPQTSSAVNGSRGLCQSSLQKLKKKSLCIEHELEEENVKPQEVDQREQVSSQSSEVKG